MNKDATSKIKQKAIELGFSACGVAKADKLRNEETRVKHFLENDYHGKIDYLANHFDKRLDPRLLVDEARSIIVVLLNYFPDKMQKGKAAPIVSKYAYGNDYHKVVKDKLFELMQFIDSCIAPVRGRAFVDSAPVLERAWAVQAGLGWIGKNGLLINKELGSYCFIGELIIDLELEYDQPYEKEHCGLCNQCLSACPASAFHKPYILDARRCISYLTIELKDDVPEELKLSLSNRIFGCDICQDVCPWNRKLKPHNISEILANKEMLSMDFEAWQNLSKDEFNVMFAHSPLKRAGYLKIKQNICNVNKNKPTN